MEKGKRKWVRIITCTCIYMYTQLAWYIRVSMRIKKEARQVKQKFFKFKKGEYRDRQHA